MSDCILNNRNSSPLNLVTYTGPTVSGTTDQNGHIYKTVNSTTAGMTKILSAYMTKTWTPDEDIGNTHTAFSYTLSNDMKSITLEFFVAYSRISAQFDYKIVGVK